MRLAGIFFVIAAVLALIYVSSPRNVASMFRHGNFVPWDAPKAREWYVKAAKEGDIDAAYDLATMYDAGEGGPQDPAEADRWMRSAAASGQGLAEWWVARNYMWGLGVEKKIDYEQAYFWARLAVRNDPNLSNIEQTAVSHLSAEKIAELNKRVAEWKPAPFVPPAAEKKPPETKPPETKPAKGK